MIENLLIIVSYDLNKIHRYASRRPKSIIVEIGKEYALSNVLQPIGEDYKIE